MTAAENGSTAVSEQLKELLRLYPGAHEEEEGGVTFYLLPNIEMPEGCQPATVDALLCPTTRDGYASRLFFAERLTGDVASTRNWNSEVRLFERTWYAISWRTRAGLRLAQMASAHLDAFRRK